MAKYKIKPSKRFDPVVNIATISGVHCYEAGMKRTRKGLYVHVGYANSLKKSRDEALQRIKELEKGGDNGNL